MWTYPSTEMQIGNSTVQADWAKTSSGEFATVFSEFTPLSDHVYSFPIKNDTMLLNVAQLKYNWTNTYIHTYIHIYVEKIDLSGATTLGQSESESDGKQGVFFISKTSRITGVLPSDCLVSYQDTRWGSLTPMQRYSRCPSRLGLHRGV